MEKLSPEIRVWEGKLHYIYSNDKTTNYTDSLFDKFVWKWLLLSFLGLYFRVVKKQIIAEWFFFISPKSINFIQTIIM